MAGSLIGISSQVLSNAEMLERVAVEVRENAHDNGATTEELSAGMEETAASTQEMTAAIQEIDSNVGAISEKAKEGGRVSAGITSRALSLRKDAVESAEHAQDIYNSVRAKMEQAIEESVRLPKSMIWRRRLWTSRARRIFWRSMPRLKRRGREKPGEDSRWWPGKSASWQRNRRRPHRVFRIL